MGALECSEQNVYGKEVSLKANGCGVCWSCSSTEVEDSPETGRQRKGGENGVNTDGGSQELQGARKQSFRCLGPVRD